MSIHAVEAEHASALADLVAPSTDLFAPEAFATPHTPDQVMQIVAPFFLGAASDAGGGEHTERAAANRWRRRRLPATTVG